MTARVRLVIAAALCAASVPFTPAEAATDHSSLTRWTKAADFANGTNSTVTYDDPYASGGAKAYASRKWTSPWKTTGFTARTLIPSWNITAPSGTWARIEARVKSGSTAGSWDTIANWGYSTAGVHRTSLSTQTDDLARVDVDTVTANGGKTFNAWQLRVSLIRPKGATTKPTLLSVTGVVASYAKRNPTTSYTTMTASKTLAVPTYSQMIHKGQYSAWGGGGEAWCSPTSTVMVLRYFKSGPKPADYSWATAKNYSDGFVDHAARYTYDYRYEGTGNWPFNAAYAGRYGLDAFVTRLTNLRAGEAYIRAGIPLVASIAFTKGHLDGAPISSTPGHMLVIVGFTKAGDVVVNDPAASKNSTVRRTYKRAQFEKAWLGGSGGVVYVIRPHVG